LSLLKLLGGRLADGRAQAHDLLVDNLGARATRHEIDAFLDGLPDQELAYLVVEATRVVKRRLARGPGRGLGSRGSGRGHSPLAEAMRRLAGDLMAFDEPNETW
jgi:hypothetical protein